ncbi:MAG: hypothetical protein ACRC2V_03150 [Xenococcaceae cyanobacterium]
MRYSIRSKTVRSIGTEQKPKNIDPVLFAEHCAKYIDKRGVKDCPLIESPASDTLPESNSNDLDNLNAEVQKLINLYGLEKVKKIIALQ